MATGKQPSEVLNSIPFERIIGDPLSACIAAQAEASRTTLDYIKETTMEDSGLGVDSFKPATVSFVFQIDGVKRIMVIPLLTIVPIPYLNIDYVNLSFTANVTSFQNEKIQACFTAPRTNIDLEAGEEYAEEHLIDVDIHATTADMPAGLARMLEVFGSRLIQVEKLEKEEVDRLRAEHLNAEQQNAEQQNAGQQKPGPRREPSTAEKEKAISQYENALSKGDSAEIRKRRNTLLKLLTHQESRALFRRNDLPEQKVPFLIRLTVALHDHPDCEYDPTLSISANISSQSAKSSKQDMLLRRQLIYALRAAQAMYPNDSTTPNGKAIAERYLEKMKNRSQGWYTFGESYAPFKKNRDHAKHKQNLARIYKKDGRIDKAFKAFVDYVIANEKLLTKKKKASPKKTK